MHTDDTGAIDLLRRASDDLTPDVDRLVSGGISRGRARQRRARFGAAVAPLAVIGVMGTLAAVVPWLDDGTDRARDPGIAMGGSSATPTPTPTDEATPTTPAEDPAGEWTLRDIPAAEIPEVALSLLATGSSLSVSAADVHLDDPERKVVRVRYDGMITELGVHRSDPPSLAGCRRDARGVDGSCQELPDGSVLLTWGPDLTDGVTCHGAALERAGYELYATSCNASSSRDARPLAPEPPLSLDELVQVLVADYWFE
jgi:hypothetical protein